MQETQELAELRDQIRAVADRAELIELVHRHAALIDDRGFEDPARLAGVYAQDIVLEFPGGRTEGIDAMAGVGRQTVSSYEVTQHVVTNTTVDVDGDRASLRSIVIAYHVASSSDPSTHFDVGGFYNLDAVRTRAGWRLSRVGIRMGWSSGVPASESHASALSS